MLVKFLNKKLFKVLDYKRKCKYFVSNEALFEENSRTI